MDVWGYYAALGVAPSASASEIKSAYRTLAKVHHPDSTTSQGDAEIKRINEAYATLSDPDRRATYDSASINPESAEAGTDERIAPLRCSRCNKIAAQVRYLIFWRVYSLILATVRTPVQGLFCSTCAKAEALRSTTITALLGWWGVPWGPVWTIACGFQNATGGKQDKERNEAYAWYNVVAFIQAKQMAIAYALADKLATAESRDIRTAAGDFTAMCRSHGFQPQGELKDSWSGNRRQTPARLAILAALPIFLTGWIYIEESSSGSTSYPSAAETYVAPNVAEIPNLAEADAASSVKQAVPEPSCASVPTNGEILAGGENLSAEGHRLEIDNGSSGDAIVKVRNTASGGLYAAFFVARGETAAISGIGDGEYRIQYAVGTRLAEDCASFAGDAQVAEFPGPNAFQAEHVDDYRGTGIIYQRLTYTLYAVPGGNVRPATISAEEFNSN